MGHDPNVLRQELRTIMSSLHPDKNGGDFKTDDDKVRFLKIKEAIEFLDVHSHMGSAMIPVSQLPAVISALSQALTVRSTSESSILQSNYLADSRARISRRFALPKIGSGVFATSTGFLVTFADNFEKHPILGPLLNNHTAQLSLLVLMGYSAAFFLFTWYRERAAEARSEYLLSESALSEVFEMISRHQKASSNSPRVNSQQILEAIQNLAGYRRYANVSFGAQVDLPTIEKAATIQTQRLIERKLLTRIDVPSIDTWYEIHGSTYSSKV